MICRHCNAGLRLQMIDLGSMPVSNAFLDSADEPEQYYPLRVLVCGECGLVQTDLTLFTLGHEQLFTKTYPYYSSMSNEYLRHARDLVAKMAMPGNSLTVEVGSNDGYLLQYVQTPCYGIEPTQTGEKARDKGICSLGHFFTGKFAQTLAKSNRADWMICNNVLAHVPDINDFVKGFATLLKPDGVATFEFPWLINLVNLAQFDTIYHEHYSYLSLTAVINVFKTNGLAVYDVEKIPTHGGSLRVYAQPLATGKRDLSLNVLHTLAEEKLPHDWCARLQAHANQIKDELLDFLLRCKRDGTRVAGFGAAAKANTLLNYAGIKADLLPYVVDDTPAKQGKFMPGSRIPVLAEFRQWPEYVVIFPWNFRNEIMCRLEYLRSVGTKFVFAVPRFEIV